MNIRDLLVFIQSHLADGSITQETLIKSRSGGYEQQFLSHVSIERDHNGVEPININVLNISADE